MLYKSQIGQVFLTRYVKPTVASCIILKRSNIMEKEKISKFEIILINDEKELNAKEAELPCKDCIIDFTKCDPTTQNDQCGINYA